MGFLNVPLSISSTLRLKVSGAPRHCAGAHQRFSVSSHVAGPETMRTTGKRDEPERDGLGSFQ
jgi:hypothetical protein